MRPVARRPRTLPLGRRVDQQDAGLLILLGAAVGEPGANHRGSLGEQFSYLGWEIVDADIGNVALWSAESTDAVLIHLAGRLTSVALSPRVATALLQR